MERVTLKDFKFFRDNAGYIVGERAMSAISLARAEKYSQAREWYVVWEFEDYSDDHLGDHSYWCTKERSYEALSEYDMHEAMAFEHTHDVTYAVLKDTNYEPLSSLGGIIDPGTNYARVIEAELASEAIAKQKLII